jgi:hypothetical protein
MSFREKLLILAVLIVISVGSLGHHYWAVVAEVLQRLIAASLISFHGILARPS